MSEATPSGENSNQPAAAVSAPVVSEAPTVTTGNAAPAAAPDPAAAPAPAAAVAETPAADPEAYDLKIGEQPVNPAILDAIAPVLKKAGVKAADAQELVAAYAAVTKTLAADPAYRKQQADLANARDLETLKADSKLGGLNLVKTQARVNDALAAFTSPQERQVLTDLGIANNPTLVRMFHRIGLAMSEMPAADIGQLPREKLSREKKLYGGRDLKKSGVPLN